MARTKALTVDRARRAAAHLRETFEEFKAACAEADGAGVDGYFEGEGDEDAGLDPYIVSFEEMRLGVLCNTFTFSVEV